MVKTQYIDSDKLLDYISKSGYRQSHIIEQLGISRQAFDKKKKGITSFRASEIYVLCDLLKIPAEERPKIFCVKGCDK